VALNGTGSNYGALSGWGSNLSPGRVQRIISSNYYARNEQGDNPRLEKEGSTVSSINCDLL